jgi:hypothetical protein
MYRPALQERLRESNISRPTSALGTRPLSGSSRPQSASVSQIEAHLQKTSDYFQASRAENRIDESLSLSTFMFPPSRPQSAISSSNGSSKSMRDDAKLVFQELQRIHLVTDYTLKFSNSTGTCSADILRDYLICLEQYAGSLEKPFSLFLQQERNFCKERADVLNMFHQKYLELVRISLKQLSAACHILKQVDDKQHRDANAAHQGIVSAAQAQSLLNAKTQELTAAQNSFAQIIDKKQAEFLASEARCNELTMQLNEIKEIRDQDISKAKEWYQWELQFAEDKLDQAELKIQLLQEQLSQLKTGLVISSKKEQSKTAATQSSFASKGTQTFWKTGDISMNQGSNSVLKPDSRKIAQSFAAVDSRTSLSDDDDDEDDAIKSRLRKFLIPPAAGDIQAIKKRALVELILEGTLESGSIEYLKAVDSGKALSKELLLRSISEVYATRTLLLQSGEGISPYLTQDLGRFTLAHYRQRFGLKKTAEKRTSGIIRSVRTYRSSSNRIDLFGQFFGIDSNLPPKCLDIYLKLLIYIENMPEAPHIENEDATAICWVPLEKFITACEQVVGPVLEFQDLEDIFAKAQTLAVPNAKKKHVLKINFDKICCSIFSLLIHASQANTEMEVTNKLLNGIHDAADESSLSRRMFFEIISVGNPSVTKLSTDTLFDEGIKRQHGLLSFNSDDGRLRLNSETCSNLINEFVLDGAPGHAPGLELQNARQTVLDALTTFWMRNGKVIEMKLKETQIIAARLAQTMHSFFKGYLQKENTLSLWILTRSMIADLKLGKIIAERTQNPENTVTAKLKGTVKKLVMVSCIKGMVWHVHLLINCSGTKVALSG